jgi:hypothetical protein
MQVFEGRGNCKPFSVLKYAVAGIEAISSNPKTNCDRQRLIAEQGCQIFLGTT